MFNLIISTSQGKTKKVNEVDGNPLKNIVLEVFTIPGKRFLRYRELRILPYFSILDRFFVL